MNAVVGYGSGCDSSIDLAENDSPPDLYPGIYLDLFGHSLQEACAFCCRSSPESYLGFFESSIHGLCHDPKLVLEGDYAVNLGKRYISTRSFGVNPLIVHLAIMYHEAEFGALEASYVGFGHSRQSLAMSGLRNGKHRTDHHGRKMIDAT